MDLLMISHIYFSVGTMASIKPFPKMWDTINWTLPTLVMSQLPHLESDDMSERVHLLDLKTACSSKSVTPPRRGT